MYNFVLKRLLPQSSLPVVLFIKCLLVVKKQVEFLDQAVPQSCLLLFWVSGVDVKHAVVDETVSRPDVPISLTHVIVEQLSRHIDGCI